MSETWAFYLDCLDEHRSGERRRYEMRERRHRLRVAADAAVAAFHGPKGGLLAFSPERLAREGNEYLEYDPCAYTSDHEHVVRLRRVALEERDGELRAIADGGEDLGYAGPEAFEAGYRPGRREDAWKAPGADRLVPLHAPIDDHPAGARLLALGSRLNATRLAIMGSPFAHDAIPEIVEIQAIDEAIANVGLDFAVANATGRVEVAAADRGFDPETGIAKDLARDLRTMDWTHDQADRTVPGAHEQERRIRRTLATMDLDEALAAMAAHARHAWFHHARAYLRAHPRADAWEKAQGAVRRLAA